MCPQQKSLLLLKKKKKQNIQLLGIKQNGLNF